MHPVKSILPPAEILSRITLLFVEDESVTRIHLSKVLSRMVGEVIAAKDGSEGLRLFREKRPDMVLTDINMPGLNGLDMAAIIKSESPETPVIALTAHDEEHYLHKAIEVGLDGYVGKPIDLDALTPVIFKNARMVLQRKQDEARAQLVSYLLDINPHLIVSCARGVVDYANKTFLQHLGHDSLESLLEGTSGKLSEVHVAGSRYKVKDSSWISKLRKVPGDYHRACFSAEGQECSAGGTFWVSSRHFPDLDRDIVTFTDITPLERERAQLLYRATTDNLTGVFNRYKLSEYINAECVRFRRYRTPLCLIMFDIDHFKNINDTHGHAEGDRVLVELSGMIMRSIRDTDSLGRWGGEEFIILSPHTSRDEAVEFSERLRRSIESNAFQSVGRVTCSFGVAEIVEGESVDSLLSRVDNALYKAKNNGRNRVETD